MKTNQLIILIVTLALIGGLFLILRATNTSVSKNQTPSATATSTTPTPNSQVYSLQIKDKKLVVGPEVIQIKEGQELTLKITSDQEGELHLHGYDKVVNLEKDKAVELTFTANLTGHFIYELEDSKTDIGAIDVLPK